MNAFERTGLMTTRFGSIDPGENWAEVSAETDFVDNPSRIEVLGKVTGLMVISSDLRPNFESMFFEDEVEEVLEKFATAARPPIVDTLSQQIFVDAGKSVVLPAQRAHEEAQV